MNYANLGNIKKLKDISYDSANEEYMTESEIKAIDFDSVKENYLKKLKLTTTKAHSVDALAKGIKGLFYMIEFKNGDCRKEAHGINLKVRDSLLILCDLCSKKISDTRKDIVFVLVYNSSKTDFSSLDRRAIAQANKSGTASTFLGLDKIAGLFVKKVLIFDKDEADRKLITRLTDIT